jgi:uncharacterized protein (TIGR02231 family)
MRLPILLPFVSLCLLAEAPLPVTAPIRSVRLHPDEAWVTRTGRVRVAGPGLHQLQFKALPAGLELADVRVSAKGPEGTRLGDLAVGSEIRKVSETPEYQALKRERDVLRDRQDGLEAEGEALAQEQLFLKNLQAAHDKELSGRMTYALPGAAAVVELSKGIQVRTTELLTRDRRRRHELEKLKEEAARMDQELRQRAAERMASPGRAQVEIATTRAGDLEVELTYRTRRARWEPAYEARLSPDGRKVELVLFAAVRQNSGEDWGGVRLEITNARASRSLTLAAFDGPQTIGYSDEPPYSNQGRLRAKKASAAAMEVMAAPPPTLAPGVAQNTFIVDAEQVEASPVEETQGLAATWALDGDKEVPADNEPHRFRVLSREVEPTLALVAVPRLDPTVYRLARFPVPSGIPLFPGAPIVHFAGTQRVGQAALALPAPGKPLQLGFGPFRGVRVSLQRLEAKKEQVGAFTKENQWTLRERFELSNDGDEAVRVEVQDRDLRSGNDKVKVAILPESTPAQDGPLPGVRAWSVALAPRAAGSVLLATQIRTPAGGYVSGLGNLNLPE